MKPMTSRGRYYPPEESVKMLKLESIKEGGKGQMTRIYKTCRSRKRKGNIKKIFNLDID
jgi:hypothetical protein